MLRKGKRTITGGRASLVWIHPLYAPRGSEQGRHGRSILPPQQAWRYLLRLLVLEGLAILLSAQEAGLLRMRHQGGSTPVSSSSRARVRKMASRHRLISRMRHSLDRALLSSDQLGVK